MNTDTLNADLWRTVERVAHDFELGIAPNCAADIKSFIADGVKQLSRENLLHNYSKIAEAETKLIAFVGGMALEAHRRNLPELQELTFHAARGQFCPLWPFC